MSELRRQMGLPAAIAVVTGESIALGIFLTPAAMAKSLGSPLLLAAVWCGMAFIAICGASASPSWRCVFRRQVESTSTSARDTAVA